MNTEFCNHLPHKTNDDCLLQCSCGLKTEKLCCECRRRIDTSKSTNAFVCSDCPRLVCHVCLLDCTRNQSAARCERCSAARHRVFEAKRWCLLLRVFFVDHLNAVKVENHIVKKLFRSTKQAVDSIPIVLGALYPGSEIIEQLMKATTFPVVPETQIREVIFSTDTGFLKGCNARVEFQLKLMIDDVDGDVLPSQMNV